MDPALEQMMLAGMGGGAPAPAGPAPMPMDPMAPPPADPMGGMDPMAADPMMGAPMGPDPMVAQLAAMFPSLDTAALAQAIAPLLAGDQQAFAMQQQAALGGLAEDPNIKMMLAGMSPAPPMVGPASEFDRSATADGGGVPMGY